MQDKVEKKVTVDQAALLVKAFSTPTRAVSDAPWNKPDYFCPGVLQREYMVAAKGDCVLGMPVTHIATTHVSSCLTIVLHGNKKTPVTGLMHLDDKTDILQSIETTLSEFPYRPNTAQIVSRDFREGVLSMIKDWPGGIEKAKSAVNEMWNARLQRTQEIAIYLAAKGIDLQSAFLESPHTTFIADISTGRIWAGNEPAGAIWHYNNPDETLAQFYGSQQHTRHGIATNPYKNMMDRHPA